MERSKKVICLFDVDGTLLKPMNKIEQDMVDSLRKLKEKVYVGVVGGSDFKKIEGQLGSELAKEVDFLFTENGLYSLQNGTLFHKNSLKDELGEEKLKKFINFCLKYLSEIDIPVKRGTFIEFRNGMLNVSPIGRNCSQQERDEFEAFDKVHKIREKFVATCKENFDELQFSIGGQISFDVFPKGWDKTYCLKFLNDFEEIYFFGDKTMPGGNDYEIFSHERTKGYTVSNPLDTIKYLQELFLRT